MNWILFLEVCFSGLFAGFFTWLISPGGHPWDLIENFQTGLLTTGVFCGLFTGLVMALPVLTRERRPAKALGYWISAASVGLSVTMLGGVIFTIFVNVLTANTTVASGVLRFFWWMFLSCCLSGCFGILHGSLKIMCRSLMGLTPAFIFAGAFVDRFFLLQQHYLPAFLFLGGMIGFGFALAWEILKENWLDEEVSRMLTYRYYLDSPEFIAGSSDECDLTLAEGPPNLFAITEKEGIHAVEALDQDQGLRMNRGRFRYRVLVDGDTINVGTRVFVYHSKLARTRDVMPEATA